MESTSNNDDQFFDALDEFQYEEEISSLNSSIFEGISHKQRRDKILNALKQCESSTTTLPPPTGNTVKPIPASARSAGNENSSSFLVFTAGIVVKAIIFQLNILLNFISFPIRLSYFSFLFVTDPYHTLIRVIDGLNRRVKTIWNIFSESFAPYLFEKVKGQKSLAKLGLRFGWGFVISVYICFVLFGLLVVGFGFGGVMIRYLVQEPFHMQESLNFDYTRASPVALVPIVSCANAYSEVRYHDVGGKSFARRVLPPNHKMQLTISLLMPESDYNRNLGVFQVRVDFLSENGEVTASSRLPCMLRFKSHILHYLETFLKSVPLLAGYSSEAQVIDVNMRGFTEGYKPTSCIRVILEQRAEYRTGAGIPEIYTATLLLESKLPLLRRFIWYWKKTIFVWISLASFTMEVLMLLLCCSPVLIPRARPMNSSTTDTATSNAPQNNVARVSEAGTRVTKRQQPT